MINKPTRLTRQGVEDSIAEMYSALAALPADPNDTADVFDQAAEIEKRLRARLDAQERLDQAAPELLSACRLLVDNWGAVEASGIVARARQAIEAAGDQP